MKKNNVIINSLKIVPVVLFAVTLFALNSCGGGTEEGEEAGSKTVNADKALNAIINTQKPPFIMSVSAMQLFTKSNFENLEVPLDPMMWNMMLKNIKDPKKSGIDLNSKIYLMMEPGAKMEKGEGMVSVFMKVSSASAVKSHVSTFLSPKTETKNGYTFGKLKGGAIGWNDNYAILVLAMGKDQRSGVVDKLDELMGTTANKSGSEMAIGDFIAAESDMGFYVSAGNMIPQMTKEVPVEGKAAFEYMTDLMKDGHTESHVYFEDNKIRAKMVNDYPGMEGMNFLNDKGVSADYLSYLTNDKLIGFYTASANVDAIFDMVNGLIEKSGQANEIEMAMAMLNINMDQLKDLFTGDMSMSVTGLKKVNMMKMMDMMPADAKEKIDEAIQDTAVAREYNNKLKTMREDYQIVPNVVFTVGTNNPEFFTTIFDTIPEMVKKTGYYSGADMANIVVKDNKIVFTTDETLAQIIAGTGKLTEYNKGGIDQAVTGSPMAGYFNGEDWSAAMESVFEEGIPEELKGLVNVLKETKVWGNMSEINLESEIAAEGENSLAVITRLMFEGILKQQRMKEVDSSSAEREEAGDVKATAKDEAKVEG
jgi:hypothetical protein